MSKITIKTKEEMINTINTNFTGKAVREGTQNCTYLNSEGKRCAIGCFIPVETLDEEEIEELIGLDVRVDELVHTKFKDYLPSNNIPFLMDFQGIHDYCKLVSEKAQKENLVRWLDENYDYYDHSENNGQLKTTSL